VTFDGQPIPEGTITFEPLEVQEESGDGFAHIKDGKFDTRNDGRGHYGGKHKVIITASSGTLVDPNDPDSGTKPLFEPYETTVEFSEEQSTQDFAVE